MTGHITRLALQEAVTARQAQVGPANPAALDLNDNLTLGRCGVGHLLDGQLFPAALEHRASHDCVP